MAYKIIGTIQEIGKTENLEGKSGTFQRRTLVLLQRRFNPNTGEEYTPNYPSFDFSGNHVNLLDSYKVGERVQVSFEAIGTKYIDKNTNEEKYFNSLRGFNINHYVAPNAQPTQQQPRQMPVHSDGAYRQAPQQYTQYPQGSQQPPQNGPQYPQGGGGYNDVPF